MSYSTYRYLIDNYYFLKKMAVSLNCMSKFISYDGTNIIMIRQPDSALLFRFYDGNRYGIGFFGDPYKSSLEDVSKTALGYKLISVNKNNIILVKGKDHLYLADYDMYNVKNIQSTEGDKYKMGNPTINWNKKVNPYKSDDEQYMQINFINDNFISAISSNSSSHVNNYILNLKTNEWINVKDIRELDKTTKVNYMDSRMMFYLDCEKSEDNFTVVIINGDIIEKTVFTIKNMTNLACSRQAKMLSNFDKAKKELNVLSFEKFFNNNLDWETHKIEFLDEKEFYITHNISTNAFIVATSKNIYVKLIGIDEWYPVLVDTSDTYIINDLEGNLYDTSSSIWTGIHVNNDKVVCSDLIGNTYFMKYTENGIVLKNTELNKMFEHEIFNQLFENAIFDDKYKITCIN
jgi:hypothetical protein